jgi:hypothetical protein
MIGVCFCAGRVGLYACPKSNQHLSGGAGTYIFYTLGPDLEHGVELYLCQYKAATTTLALGHSYGSTTIVSKWASKGFLHRFRGEDGNSSSLSAGGVLVGILIGQDK